MEANDATSEEFSPHTCAQHDSRLHINFCWYGRARSPHPGFPHVRPTHRRDGRLAQIGLEDLDARLVVRQRDVNELVEAAGPQDGRVDDVGAVRRADDEHVLLGAHAVHLRQQLVDDAVRRAAAVTHIPAARLGDRVQLVEEEHARRSGASLQKRARRKVTSGGSWSRG